MPNAKAFNTSYIFENDSSDTQSVGSLADLLGMVDIPNPSAPPGSQRPERTPEAEILQPAQPLESERAAYSPSSLRKVKITWFAIGFHVVAIPALTILLGVVIHRRMWYARLPLADGMDCRQDTNCLSGVCALSNTTSSQSSLICCPLGGHANGYDDSGVFVRVCTNMPVGTSCGSIDAICDGFCINGLCVASALRTSERCDRGEDCESKSCGHSEASLGSPTVCCPSEGTMFSRVPMSSSSTSSSRVAVNVCKSLPVGAFCDGQGSLCASGLCIEDKCSSTALPDFEPCTQNKHCQNGVCGLVAAEKTNETICCPNGASTRTTILSANGEIEIRCAKMPTRTKCYDTNEICETRTCVNGRCADKLLEHNELCGENSDCKSGTCALGYAGDSSPSVCCSSSATAGYADGEYMIVCNDRPVSTICGEFHSICAKGLACIAGVCSDLLLDNEQCVNSKSCASNSCGRGDAKPDAPATCCSSGKLTGGLIEIEGKEHSVALCAGQPSGTFCADIDAICGEGHSCVKGVCGQPLRALEVCNKAKDCENGVCALESATPNAPTVCCASAKTTNGYVETVSGRTYSAVCSDQGVGSFCGTIDSVCTKGLLCNNSVCAVPLVDGAPCDESAECNSGKCAHRNPNATSITICCEASQISYMALHDTGDTVVGYGEVCMSQASPSPTPELPSLMPSGFVESPVPVQVRTISLLYFGLDDADVPDNDIDDVGNLTCELMMGHLRAEFNGSIYTRDCGVISRQSGPALSYSIVVNFRPSSVSTEDEVFTVLKTFFTNRQDYITGALSNLALSNIFQQTTRVFLKLGLV